MSDKDPAAFRTISEVAVDLDLPQHVLRFWETKFSQIRPMKSSGGRRFYRPDDVALLRAIREMLYGQGYTIRGVQRVLKERGARDVAGARLETNPVAVIPRDDAMPTPIAITPSTQTAEQVRNDDPSSHLQLIWEELRTCIAILRDARG